MSTIKKFLSSKTGKILLFVVSLIPTIIALWSSIYYILGPGMGYFHADCTDSMYWANATVESGKVFDESFRYAALLPFSACLWMVPLIEIFGLSMTAHNIAMIIFAILFAGSIWFLCRSAGFGYGWCSVSVFAVFSVLSSSVKLREILWGHTIYYSVGLIIMFTAGALAIKVVNGLENGKKISPWIFASLLLIIAAGAATDGSQVIVIGTLPVIAGLCAERIFCRTDKLISKKSLCTWIPAAAACVGTVIGLVLLKIWTGDTISAGYADAYSGWSKLTEWINNANNFVNQYFSLIGVDPGSETLFSADSIKIIVRVAGGITILVVPFVLLFMYKKLSRPTRVMLFAHFVNSAAIMFGFICGKLSGANWRLTPIVGSCVMISMMGIRDLTVREKEPISEDNTTSTDKKTDANLIFVRLSAILLAVIMLFSVIVIKEIKAMPADYGRDNTNHKLAEFLEEKGLEYGYATFWYCQTITMLSDSRVKCREVLANRSGVYSDYYQSSRNWYVNQDYDKFFVLLSESEYANVATSQSWKDWVANYKIASYGENDDEGVDGFYIFVFSRNVLDITD